MTKDEIMKMARDAGVPDPMVFIGAYERFSALVAAAEREACAQLAAQTVCDTHLPTGIKIYGTAVAKAISARSNK